MPLFFSSLKMHCRCSFVIRLITSSSLELITCTIALNSSGFTLMATRADTRKCCELKIFVFELSPRIKWFR